MPTPNARMDVDQEGLDFITKWEGLVLHVYKDVAGKKTYGVGHLVRPEEDAQFPLGKEITRDFAMKTLHKDVRRVVEALRKYVTVKLNQNQFNALASFAFNVGVGPFADGSAVLDAVNARDFGLVPERLNAWRNITVNGVKQPNEGLINRRRDEGSLFMRPVAPSRPASQRPSANAEVQTTPSSWNANHLALLLAAVAGATMAHYFGLKEKIFTLSRTSTKKRRHAPQR
jgi:lysozyme